MDRYCSPIPPRHTGAKPPPAALRSPWNCATITFGRTLTIRGSDDLDACPQLSDRGGQTLTAACLPLITWTEASACCTLPSPTKNDRCSATDPLIGQLSRYRLEDKAQQRMSRSPACAVPVAHLDCLKLLNEVHGQAAGDRRCSCLQTCCTGPSAVTTWLGSGAERSSSSCCPARAWLPLTGSPGASAAAVGRGAGVSRLSGKATFTLASVSPTAAALPAEGDVHELPHLDLPDHLHPLHMPSPGSCKRHRRGLPCERVAIAQTYRPPVS